MDKIVCATDGAVPKPPHVSDELLRDLARVVHEWQRLEAGRSTEQIRRRRPDPPTFREMTAADRELAKDEDHWLSDYMRAERSDRYRKQAALGRGRCEAGVKEWDLLRCQRSSAPGERWCTQHHPSRPKPVPGLRRLTSWDLGARPDGELIGAVYELADRVHHLERVLLANLDRIEQGQVPQAPDLPQVLDVKQAAEMLGLSTVYMYRLCKEHRVPYSRVGVSIRFQRHELEKWLRDKTLPAVR